MAGKETPVFHWRPEPGLQLAAQSPPRSFDEGLSQCVVYAQLRLQLQRLYVTGPTEPSIIASLSLFLSSPKPRVC